MKKIGFLFFALLVGLIPAFSSAATIANEYPSLWLKPQKATSTTCGVELGNSSASWINNRKDCSGNGKNASHPGGQVEPQRYADGGTNFHPRVSFKDDGSDGKLGWLNGVAGNYFSTFIVWNLSKLEPGHVPFSVVADLANNTLNNNRYIKGYGTLFSYSVGNTSYRERDIYKNAQVNGGGNLLRTPGVHIYYGYGKNGSIDGRDYRIGPKNYANYSSLMKDDDIYEVISFPKEDLNAEVEKKVASYLAIKYGIPLRHDYFAGDGSKIYDRSNYGNQVFGLGKDTSTSLDQRIAKALEDDDLIISTDDDFTKLNDQHTELSNNRAYLLLGNNPKTYTQTTTDGLEKSANEQYFTMRSQKIWKVQNTNFGKQKVNLQFASAFRDLAGNDDKYVLLVSSDETKFSELEMVKGTGEIIGGKLIFKNVEFPAGTNYMTLAIRDLTAPEGLDFDGAQYFPRQFFSGANFPLATTGTKDLGVGIREFVWTIKKGTDEIGIFTGSKNFDIPICQSETATNCIPEGRGFRFEVSAIDRAGNKIVLSDIGKPIGMVVIDRTAPIIAFVSGNDEVWINYGESFNISTGTLSVSDNLQHSAIKIDLKTDPDPLPTAPFTGSFRVIYTATDWAGNSSQKERIIRVNEAPTIEGLSVDLGSTNDKTKPTITFTPKDETRNLTTGKIEIYEGGTDTLLSGKDLNSLNNGTPISETFTLDEKTFYTVKVKIRDEGGLFAEKELSYPPTVNFEPASFPPTSGDIQVKVKIWSPGTLSEVKFEAPFSVKVNEIPVLKSDNFLDKCITQDQNTTCQLTISSSASQTGDLKIVAKDNYSVGNNTLKLIIDKTKPETPVFTSPSEKLSQKNKNLTFQWNSLTDEGGAELDKIYWKLKKGSEIVENGEFIDLTTRTFEKTDMADGIYTLTLWTQDKAGNISDETTSNAIQIDTTAPNAIKNLTSVFDSDTAKLSFVWSGTTDNGVGLSGYLWTFKKGSQELDRGELGDEATPVLNFENIAKEDASYTLSLQAVDQVENKTPEQTVTFEVQLVELTFKAGEHLTLGMPNSIQLFSGAKQENLTLPILTPDPGYKLKDPARNPAFNTSDRATANKTYTGQAEKDSSQRVNLTINHQGGTGTQGPLEILKTTELTYISLASSKTGFSLTGWATSSGGTILPADTKFTENTELFALWEKDPSQWIEIQFETQGGTAISPNPDTFLIGTQASELPKSQKSGFTFDGWNYTGEAILTDNASLTKSETLYANWTKDANQRATLSFDVKGGNNVSSIEVLKNAELLSGDLPTTTKTGYTFSGWSLDEITVLNYPTSFDQNQTLHALWEKDPSKWLSLTYDLQGGTLSTTNPDQLLSGTLVSTLAQPTKNGFHFSGWNFTGQAILADNASLTTSGTLYANRSENPLERLTITYHLNDGSAQQQTGKLLKDGATFQALNPEPTRTGHTFNGWTKDSVGQEPIAVGEALTGDLHVYAQWKPIPSAVPTYGYSGGGGGAVSHSTSQNSTPSPQEPKNPDLPKGDQEQQTAYERAYENKITTLYPQQEARLFEPITRAELAKMMSVYATKFLEKVPLTGKVGCADFQDKDQTNLELAGFMQRACELEIMGLHSDGKTPLPAFRPNDLVSRAEFATVLSRMKRGNLYDNNQQEGRWDNHLKNLNEKAIITVPDPMIMELRGWILLMLHRMER